MNRKASIFGSGLRWRGWVKGKTGDASQRKGPKGTKGTLAAAVKGNTAPDKPVRNRGDKAYDAVLAAGLLF